MAESIDNGSSNEEKVALFRELFFGRQDVYARRFENAKSGRSGYSPECANKWKRGVCGLPHVKCGQCGNRQFAPLQREPRQIGNSVFVKDDLVPLADQWAFLSSVRRVTREEVETFQRRGYAEHRLLLPQTRAEGREDRPWEFFAPLWGAFESPQSVPTEVAAGRTAGRDGSTWCFFRAWDARA